jgi:hypothetical protein
MFISRRPNAFFCLALSVALLTLVGCAERRSGRALSSNLPLNSQGEPEVLAAYQSWFGKPNHIQVGYSSQDPTVLQQQIEKARNLGISAFVVNWYGEASRFEDHSYGILQQMAAQNNFHTALLYDESDDPERATEDAIRDLQYAYEHYIGPNAPARNAYLTYDGKPMIFVFPKSGKTDWAQVRGAVSNWESPPLLLYKDVNQRQLNNFDGFYAWVHPGSGWQSDGSDWGRQYLDNFYSKVSQYPDKIAVGAAWPGFNDSRASWSQNRYMNARCGKTFEDSLRLYRRYFNDSHPLPFLMIDTWNDYEEGTAIEKGTGAC